MAAGESGGYDVTLLHERDKDHFKCMLCMSIIKEATHGCEDHVFCRKCILDYINTQRNNKILCPAGCRQSFNKNQLRRNKPLDHFINQLLCKCSDCDWNGELLDYYQHHEKHCTEKRIFCSYCEYFIKRKDMENHTKNNCLKRPVNCEFCSKCFPYEDHEKHEDLCGNRKVSCTFKKYGCQFKDSIRNLRSHNKKYDIHLDLIATYVSESLSQSSCELTKSISCLDLRLEKVQEENKSLKRSNTWKDEHIEKLNVENWKLRKENTKLSKDVVSLKLEMQSCKELISRQEKEFSQEMKFIKKEIELLNQNNKSLEPIKSETKSDELNDYQGFFDLISNGACKNIFCMHDKHTIRLIKENIVPSIVWNNTLFTGSIPAISDSIVKSLIELEPYKNLLNDFIRSKAAIRLNIAGPWLVFRKDIFKSFEDPRFLFRKDQDNIYFREKLSIDKRCSLIISDWFICLSSHSSVNLSKPDERFVKMEKVFDLNYGYVLLSSC